MSDETLPRPSKVDALKGAATPAATIVAVLGAISAIATALTGTANNAATDRVAYETLRAKSDTHDGQIAACIKSQAEQAAYIEELAGRIERRQATAEKAITRKVTRATAPPPPALVLEPAPKAPPLPAPIEPSALPPFDALPQ